MIERRQHQSTRTLFRSAAITIGLLASGAGMPVLADAGKDQRCAKGSDVRLIEIRFADDEGSLPCRVIYRPEAESEKVGIVSWQDIPDPAACEAQAKELTERLTVEGWTCAGDQDAAGSQADARRVQQGIAEKADLENETLPSPDAPVADDDGASTIDDFDVPARFVERPDLAPPTADLASLIQGDLSRLDVTLDGRLEAEIAGYGDLNGDDTDDALVLYTYSSAQPAYRQFLAAYVFDGEAYQLTATKPVGGSVNATKDAKVEAIDRGVVHISLKAFEPGDASCCPSGTHHLALALRDLDLVEIDADAPTR